MTEDLDSTYNKIYRYCFYKMRNSVIAEDITQEAFLKYFAQNKNLRRGEDTAYLYTIAKNLCVDYFRKRREEALTGDYPQEDFCDHSDTKMAVRNALERLGEQYKEILLLRYLGGLSANETAETLEISRFKVYRLEKAALAEMRKYLKGAL